MHAYFLHRKVMIILANNLDSHVKIQQAFHTTFVQSRCAQFIGLVSIINLICYIHTFFLQTFLLMIHTY